MRETHGNATEEKPPKMQKVFLWAMMLNQVCQPAVSSQYKRNDVEVGLRDTSILFMHYGLTKNSRYTQFIFGSILKNEVFFYFFKIWNEKHLDLRAACIS